MLPKANSDPGVDCNASAESHFPSHCQGLKSPAAFFHSAKDPTGNLQHSFNQPSNRFKPTNSSHPAAPAPTPPLTPSLYRALRRTALNSSVALRPSSEAAPTWKKRPSWHRGGWKIEANEIQHTSYMYVTYKYIISADPGLRQGRGGAWDHRRCGTCFVIALCY